uniref:Uncharacterized protein n=1 Tax=Arundo donax TaxID=35708 RepID=A0A0A9C319_ARUDO
MPSVFFSSLLFDNEKTSSFIHRAVTCFSPSVHLIYCSDILFLCHWQEVCGPVAVHHVDRL